MKEQISNSVKMELSMPDKPDQILVEQSQAGYSEAFGLLAKKYQRKVYEIAYRFTQNVDEASDLSQEVFIKAYRAYQTSKAHPSFIPGYTESPIMLVLTTQDDERIVQNICFRMSSRTIISYFTRE